VERHGFDVPGLLGSWSLALLIWLAVPRMEWLAACAGCGDLAAASPAARCLQDWTQVFSWTARTLRGVSSFFPLFLPRRSFSES